MNNEIEVIDRVKGEWRTVTKASEVKNGQRVRYIAQHGTKYGFSGCPSYDKDRFAGSQKVIFKLNFSLVQAFFPLPVRSKRKVAKVYIIRITLKSYFLRIEIGDFSTIRPKYYSTRKHAIRGARRFCKAIGYECEIQKEVK